MSLLSLAVKFVGKIACPLPKFKHQDYKRIAALAMPGDVIMSRRPCSLSNLFISGKYKHAGIVVMGNLIEARFDGVVQTDLIDFCMKKNAVCLMRPIPDPKLDVKNKVIEKAIRAVGTKYDFDLSPGADKFYCSEIIKHCWGDYVDIPSKKVLWKEVFEPSDLIGSGNWRVVIAIDKEE